MSTIYQVVETETEQEQNFYDVSLPQALAMRKGLQTSNESYDRQRL